MPSDAARAKYEIAWSVTEQKIYLTDTVEEYHPVEITFSGPLARLSKEQKLALLQEIIAGLRQSETIDKTASGYFG